MVATFRVGFIPALRDNAPDRAVEPEPTGLKLVETYHMAEAGPTRAERVRLLRRSRRNLLAVTVALGVWALALAISAGLRIAYSDRTNTVIDTCALVRADYGR